MKWKSGKTTVEFLPEKTFLIIRDNLESLTIKQPEQWTKSKSAVDTGTWPPKIKKLYRYNDEERPKTANLEKPNVLDPRLVKKLDMSLLSKELLLDSITRIRLGGQKSSGGMDMSNRRSSIQQTIGDKRSVILNAIESKALATRYKRRSFDNLSTTDHHITIKETSLESVIMKKQLLSSSNDRVVKKRSLDLKKFDDNNNRNGIPTGITNNNNNNTKPISTLSTVRTIKSSRSAISSEIEVFTSSINKLAPEPCKTCGRPDQPERFHSHPKGMTSIKIIDKDGNGNNKVKKEAERKTVQKPVALNFRSEKKKIKDENNDITVEKLNLTTNITSRSASAKKGPRTVTCYICSREFGTASFPIHEPKCMEKWERENNALPASKRRPVPKRPIVPVDDQQWNKVAWEQSQMQLVPCLKCNRTFLPDRLTVHEKTCKAIPKQNCLPLEKTDKVKSAGRNSNSLKICCQMCGRNFGTRSIKIHEPHCLKKWQNEHDASINDEKNKTSFISTSSNGDLLYKRTTTCYICGRDFGTASIDIHEPQCLKKWRIENIKLPLNQRRKEPQKPEIIFQEESASGNEIIDWSATTEARWRSHLGQLIPCKHCKRTFNPDRVSIHERTCKGSR